MCGENDKGLN